VRETLSPALLCLAALRTAAERDALLTAVESGIHVLAAAPTARLFSAHAHATCAAAQSPGTA